MLLLQEMLTTKESGGDEQEGNHHQQQNKRQEMGRVYVVGTGNKTRYAGTLPLCDKCMLHHHGLCPVKYGNCKKFSHQARDYETPTTMTCYLCGGKRHTNWYYPGSKNRNRDKEAHQNLNIVTGRRRPRRRCHIMVFGTNGVGIGFVGIVENFVFVITKNKVALEYK
nr:hypothetical protein [Tanacetum cinerariifolium]